MSIKVVETTAGDITGLYYDDVRKRWLHRPYQTDGTRTFRTLKARTQGEAIKEFGKAGKHATSVASVADLVAAYEEARYPGAGVRPRQGKFALGEAARCKWLLDYFGSMKAEECKRSHILAYHKWRVGKLVKKNVTGGRTVDLDLGTLSNVFNYAVLNDLAAANPFAIRSRFASDIEHCREHCCQSGDELHTVAKALAGVGRERGVLLALQFLFEACSGCRTGEALPLKRNATDKEPGHIREVGGKKYLRLDRLKQGDNDAAAYILINPALAIVMQALDEWHTKQAKPSKWLFPGKLAGKHMTNQALAHGLGRARRKLKIAQRLTSHGCRAFYVTWQRCEGVPLADIAKAVGHRSGVGLLLKTYGQELPAWAVPGDFTPFPKAIKPFWDTLKYQMTVKVEEKPIKEEQSLLKQSDTTFAKTAIPPDGNSTSSYTNDTSKPEIHGSKWQHDEPTTDNCIILFAKAL